MAYVCRVCDYVYMPEQHENPDEAGIKREFLRLPVKWVCPKCGAKKGSFIWVYFVKTPNNRQ